MKCAKYQLSDLCFIEADKIGSGMMSEVKLAFCKSDRKLYAVKIVL